MRAPLMLLTLMAMTAAIAEEMPPLPPDYCHWKAEHLAIDQPLCGLKGDPKRGRALAIDPHGGNCIACHHLPVPEESFHGTIGPPLEGVASRYTEGQLRLRVVDEQQVNPFTIMPGFYRDPRLANRVADEYWGKTFLTAQQVEDIVAWLVTLK